MGETVASMVSASRNALRRFGISELLEQRDADVVGAIRALDEPPGHA